MSTVIAISLSVMTFIIISFAWLWIKPLSSAILIFIQLKTLLIYSNIYNKSEEIIQPAPYAPPSYSRSDF